MRVCLCSQSVSEIPLSESMTVCAAKDMIETHLGLEPSSLTIIYKGLVLQNSLTLSAYGMVQL